MAVVFVAIAADELFLVYYLTPFFAILLIAVLVINIKPERNASGQLEQPRALRFGYTVLFWLAGLGILLYIGLVYLLSILVSGLRLS